MAPNSEEGRRISNLSLGDDAITKEKQRPPIYNPEDYALSLKKWGRKPPLNAPGLYTMNTNTVETEKAKTKANTFKDYRNPMLSESEMTLRQFGSVSELLCKLKSDLKLSYGRYENTLKLKSDLKLSYGSNCLAMVA
ncbi:hypothetical protein QE152_g8805 [Popillia japonica]|uniref:Uncharacterized protein n=1 Tax=Popillia japonica TaxID=7064 RepID=A0AAW1LWU1_POPJA